jgi:putative ABC transport system permease protein
MEDFARITEDYWVFGSGAGAALGFSAIFGLIVGAVIVGQTLYSTTKEHLRELATLKAIGATRREILAFIAWQAAVLAIVGGLLGASIAAALESVLSSQGILVRITPGVGAIGVAAVLGMCAVASVPSARKVLALAPAEVFR